ncbi:MAG: class I SAM-dependent methyltransferase, partial [Nitrososphaeraceae archaeon]|nr:class I SAM-dependent methyltransferase [Nitrososphaeraceae archaeon]
MQLKDIRQGFGYGFYPKDREDTYVIFFRDGANEMSYKEFSGQNYEYLNRLRYTSPIFVLNAISDFLHSATKEQHNEDINDTYEHKIVNYAVNIDNQTLKILKRFDSFFSDYHIEIVKKAEVTYKIKITTKKSLYNLLNFSVTYFSVMAMLAEYDLDINEGMIDKLIRCLNVVNADYYIRYVVCSRVLTNKKLYEKFKPMLEKPNMKLHFGNTAVHRRDYIRGLIQFDRSIVDIGCGSGFYCMPFSEKLLKTNPELRYYAIDTDENELDIVERKAREKELHNIVILNSHKLLLDHLKKELSYNVIITEVVEHIEKNESQELIRWVLNNVNFNKIIITTPNRSFNTFYCLQNEMRHDDHKWELDEKEFEDYMNEIFVGFDGLKVTYLEV